MDLPKFLTDLLKLLRGFASALNRKELNTLGLWQCFRTFSPKGGGGVS